MRFFIVKEENAAYYYARYKGICRKNLQSLHSGEEIYPQATDGFALFRNATTHIVCANKQNDIIYIAPPGKPHILINGREDIVPYDFTLTSLGGSLNLFYKTDFNDKILLYRCILGNSEKPYIIAELSTQAPYYYSACGRLFYTSSDGMLCSAIPENGSKTITDMYEGGTMPCYISDGGRDLLVYIKDGQIYLNKRPMAEDKYAEMPLVLNTNNATYIQWKSGDFIKYKRLENDKWSDTIQYMGTSSKPHIINIVSRGNIYPCYGYNGHPCIKIL